MGWFFSYTLQPFTSPPDPLFETFVSSRPMSKFAPTFNLLGASLRLVCKLASVFKSSFLCACVRAPASVRACGELVTQKSIDTKLLWIKFSTYDSCYVGM
jgi:hypothetical protein